MKYVTLLVAGALAWIFYQANGDYKPAPPSDAARAEFVAASAFVESFGRQTIGDAHRDAAARLGLEPGKVPALVVHDHWPAGLLPDNLPDHTVAVNIDGAVHLATDAAARRLTRVRSSEAYLYSTLVHECSHILIDRKFGTVSARTATFMQELRRRGLPETAVLAAGRQYAGLWNEIPAYYIEEEAAAVRYGDLVELPDLGSLAGPPDLVRRAQLAFRIERAEYFAYLGDPGGTFADEVVKGYQEGRRASSSASR
jgi:hypothetical protein